MTAPKNKALELAQELEESVNNPNMYWQGKAAAMLRSQAADALEMLRSQELQIIGYMRATPAGDPIWDEGCVCQDPIYPTFDEYSGDAGSGDDASISMPLVRLTDVQSAIARLLSQPVTDTSGHKRMTERQIRDLSDDAEGTALKQDDRENVYFYLVRLMERRFGLWPEGLNQGSSVVEPRFSESVAGSNPAPDLTEEEVKTLVEACADEQWPGVGHVGWASEDAEFYGRVARAVLAAQRGKA